MKRKCIFVIGICLLSLCACRGIAESEKAETSNTTIPNSSVEEINTSTTYVTEDDIVIMKDQRLGVNKAGDRFYYDGKCGTQIDREILDLCRLVKAE